MLQIMATIFFSIAAFGAATIMAALLIEEWPEVMNALGLAAVTKPLSRHVPARIQRLRPARTLPPKMRLRAAA